MLPFFLPFCLISPPLASMAKDVHHTCYLKSLIMVIAPPVNTHDPRTCLYAWSNQPFFFEIHPPASSTQGALRSLRDLTLGFAHMATILLLWSTSPICNCSVFITILAFGHLSFQHLFLHLYWISLMSCIGRLSKGLFPCTPNNLELCAQGHYNYNTSSYNKYVQLANMVTCPAPNWVVGASTLLWSTSCLHSWECPWTVGFVFLIFKFLALVFLMVHWFFSLMCRKDSSSVDSLTCTYLGFVTKPTACVASQCVTCGSNMSNLITCPTFNWVIGPSTTSSSVESTIHKLYDPKLEQKITITLNNFIHGSGVVCFLSLLWGIDLILVSSLNFQSPCCHARCMGGTLDVDGPASRVFGDKCSSSYFSLPFL